MSPWLAQWLRYQVSHDTSGAQPVRKEARTPKRAGRGETDMQAEDRGGRARASRFRRWPSPGSPCWSCPAAMAPSSRLLLRLPWPPPLRSTRVRPHCPPLETARFTAEVRDQNGQVMAGAAVVWASSDASVAAVDASGLSPGCSLRPNRSLPLSSVGGGKEETISDTINPKPTVRESGAGPMRFWERMDAKIERYGAVPDSEAL